MDLYRIDSSLRKSFTERASHFQRTDITSTVPHHNDLSKFSSNDILSSSAWSAVIHQPDQDSDPEDLPSTVDIDAIKEPPTPINASAQTPAGQLHGDSHSFELSDEQNAGDSGSDSDTDSESGNSENENAASGGDTGSCSDSDSASSHPSSSSKGRIPSSRSSRSNSPSVCGDSQEFSVRETNFEQGSLKLKLSALRDTKQKYLDGELSSDSSSKSAWDKNKLKFDNRLKNRKLYSLKSRNDCKNKSSYFSKDRLKCNTNDKESDSDSSSSSYTSPEKPCFTKARLPLKSSSKLDIPNRARPVGRNPIRDERIRNHLVNKRHEIGKKTSLNTKESVTALRYRALTSQNLPSLKLPQACKLSEDSDESLDNSKSKGHKKENSRDTIEKLAQQLTQPGTTDQLQVLNEEDLAAVLPDVELQPAENKKVISSDSSSDAELFPKQKQIVRDVINSIHVDSESNSSAVSNRARKSDDSNEDKKRNDKYSSSLLEALAEQTDRLNKNKTKAKSNVKKFSAEIKKRGRPPKSKLSSMAEIESYMRLDCTVSNVSPDSGIQSNAGSPSYHNLQPTIFNQTRTKSNKSLSLTQKAVLSASKNSHRHVEDAKNNSVSRAFSKKHDDKSQVIKHLKKTADTKTSSKFPPMLPDISAVHNDLTMFQGKRGPGRPKKIPPKANGKTKPDKDMPLRLDGPYKLTPKSAPAKSKKTKYGSPVVMCLEGRKKRRKKKAPPPLICQPKSPIPVHPTRKEWLHKHKKRKKKENKEKSVNLELLKLVDELVDVFDKKCVIEERKSSKLIRKDKMKKKKHTEKLKHSDNDSEYETASPISVAASVTSSKRRHKKCAIETPKVLETNSDQRLPLKKRHYHVSASSITSSSHQTHDKGRSDKQHSNETIASLTATVYETKTAIKANNVTKINENKSKADAQKNASKDVQKHQTKNETAKSTKMDNCKNSTKNDTQKVFKNDAKCAKNDAHKYKTDVKKTNRTENLKNKTETNKTKEDSKYDNSTEEKSDADIVVTPKKRHRLEEERKLKNELLPFLPLRRSGRKKADSPSPEANKTEVKRNSRQISAKKSENTKTPKNDSVERNVKNTDTDESTKIERPESITEEIRCDDVSAPSTLTKLQTNKPQLITPLPSEPAAVATLKPPAGVFEPSRKLPSSLAKCNKKNSIDDVLSKLQEKLKGYHSPLKNTSALIEKIGVKNETDNTERVLRSKRAGECESISAKKNRICKDMSIRLRKLSTSEITNSAATAELKPKLKRRKPINRTGFPVKKKKKRIKINSDVSTHDYGEETNIESTTEDEKTDNKDNVDECGVNKVKNELIEEHGKRDNIENKPPNLHGTVNATVKIKSEVMSEDEAPKGGRAVTKNKNKIIKSDVSNRLLPSRCSARIYIKQQIRAREIKKSKKNAVKKAKKNAKIGAAGAEKIRKEVVGKLLRPRERKNLENYVAKDCSKRDNDGRLHDETDKEEFSESESVKAQNLKKVEVPKWKRKYISAGLFSDFYKEEKHAALDAKNRFVYKEEDHPHGLLPPPPYFEDWVRRRRVDFKLPYDLWWLHTHNQLPGRDDVVHSWNYKKIRTNVYYDVKPTYMYEAQACNCKVPTEKDKLGCGEDCINRLVYAECSPQLCPLKQKCSNQKIQKHEWASKLVKFMTRDKGWGVKTKEQIKTGDFILEYVGEVVSDKEFKKRMTSLYKNDIHHYCLNLDGGLVIDGHRMGGAGRFVNHSCEPNCEMQKWSVNGLFRMALFALRDIRAGEELTYDYNFALFNPAEGQPCLCGSTNCRGVIGGKSQRVAVGTSTAGGCDNANVTISCGGNADKKSRLRPRKQTRKTVAVVNVENQSQRRDSVASSNSVGVLPQRNVYSLTPVKPLGPEEKKIVVNYRVFLIRNLIKIQHFREKLLQIYNNKENSNSLNQNGNKIEDAAAKESAVFLTHLNALSTQRFIRTRRLAQAQDDPEMTKTAQLANVFRTIYNDVVSAKDEKGEPFSSLFMTLPSKRKLPMYYQRIGDPIDLTTIEKNIVTGVYKNVELFDKDMNKLIMNSVKYYGRTSDYGIAAVRLRKEYNIAKLNYVSQIKEIVGDAIPPSFMPGQEDPGDEEEDVIRCICGLYNDEGLMIQCERCLVWQHCDCVKADTNAEHYLCERCNPRDVDYEISLDIAPEYAGPGEKHYLTLMRDDLQIRQGDTVYVLRDIFNPETGTRHSFRTIKNFKFEDCDIFRVERLWKNEKGERMSFGHHYLRPHETFHEPSRKFFTNEVVKVPLYETVPLDLIMGQCYVLDLPTYRKGRPIDSDPEHIYICEFRVDKAARLFYKLRKSKQPAVCTKNYAFDKYDTPLKPSRTYAPHGEVKPSSVAASTVPKAQVNQKTRPKGDDSVVYGTDSRVLLDMENSSNSIKTDDDELPLSHLKDSKMDKQKQRLNTILLKLLAKKSSTKTPLDASYLLDLGRRNRKKPDHFST